MANVNLKNIGVVLGVITIIWGAGATYGLTKDKVDKLEIKTDEIRLDVYRVEDKLTKAIQRLDDKLESSQKEQRQVNGKILDKLDNIRDQVKK